MTLGESLLTTADSTAWDAHCCLGSASSSFEPYALMRFAFVPVISSRLLVWNWKIVSEDIVLKASHCLTIWWLLANRIEGASLPKQESLLSPTVLGK